ncbi:proline-serine-threonine phosphatase-interacting protein 2-like [Sinocyclocheilus grahami]|uniref:proline-serine-threonine phosphatase-interacting protein 2-like n=1 Tax=Sinocyclocheilus grahami TaxID=75366 RepID=UPI0007AC55A6|nr:PREDICTED: proline-serine-threonine phosphatase-interacting protein 2-like [Sinocyclocheilus grahami]
MRELHFKDNFWNTEIISTAGYDSIIQHLNDGKRTCKEIEDFMKARAAIEEKYAKELLGLSKKVCGHSEMKIYSQNVSLLGKMREEWLNEHVKACEFFEKQEVERISTLRNVVWTHLNHLSQQCVSSDELLEEVRKSLEQCNIQEDIEHFINLRRTGDKPPASVPYENFYNNQRSAPTRSLPTAGRRAAAPPPPTAESMKILYAYSQCWG